MVSKVFKKEARIKKTIAAIANDQGFTQPLSLYIYLLFEDACVPLVAWKASLRPKVDNAESYTESQIMPIAYG